MLVGQGSLSCKAFQVSGGVPDHDAILEHLTTFAFADIDTAEAAPISGWVGPTHLYQRNFAKAQVFRGQFAVFALRVDQRKAPPQALKARLALALEAEMEESGLDSVTSRTRRQLKVQVGMELLAETPPVQKSYGVFWNLTTGAVFVESVSKTVVDTFSALFERTFELTLHRNSTDQMTTDFATTKASKAELVNAVHMLLGAGA